MNGKHTVNPLCWRKNSGAGRESFKTTPSHGKKVKNKILSAEIKKVAHGQN